jgi:tight adherence protein C
MQGTMLPVLGLLVLLGFVLLVVVMLRRTRRASPIEERLAEFGTLERPASLEEMELAQPFTQRVVAPLLRGLAQALTRMTPARSVERVRHKLDLAGNPFGWGATEFMGIRMLVALLLGALGMALILFARTFPLTYRILLTVVMVALGYFLPTIWLGRKIRARQRSIIRSLPDALDLLTICVEAGLGFDGAMAKVAEKWNDDLSQAFMRVIQEIQLGKLRREALRDMSDRMEVPDVATFVAAIIQADQLGVSLARVLRIQSDQMRVRRRQRAEELARAAPIKMLPPIAFLIFPAIFVVLLGPAVLTVMKTNIFGF